MVVGEGFRDFQSRKILHASSNSRRLGALHRTVDEVSIQSEKKHDMGSKFDMVVRPVIVLHTLIFRSLHLWHPRLDSGKDLVSLSFMWKLTDILLWVLRGGMLNGF